MMSERPDLQTVLERYGTQVTGLHGNRLVICPVHDESVPSCSVNLDKGVYNCHACGARGDSITLIMEKEHLDYAAAVRWAEENLGWSRQSSAHAGRVGLSGTARPARGGYRPSFRRRAGLSGT